MTDVVIKRVPIAQAIEAMKELTAEHWEEVPFGNYHLELNLNVPEYETLERLNRCTCIVATIEGAYVGYLVLLAGGMLHHKDVQQVVTDSFYVVPEHRENGIFPALLKKAERLCKEAGIEFLSIGINPVFEGSTDLEAYAKYKGYSQTEVTYTKRMA